MTMWDTDSTPIPPSPQHESGDMSPTAPPPPPRATKRGLLSYGVDLWTIEPDAHRDNGHGMQLVKVQRQRVPQPVIAQADASSADAKQMFVVEGNGQAFMYVQCQPPSWVAAHPVVTYVHVLLRCDSLDKETGQVTAKKKRVPLVKLVPALLDFAIITVQFASYVHPPHCVGSVATHRHARPQFPIHVYCQLSVAHRCQPYQVHHACGQLGYHMEHDALLHHVWRLRLRTLHGDHPCNLVRHRCVAVLCCAALCCAVLC